MLYRHYLLPVPRGRHWSVNEVHWLRVVKKKTKKPRKGVRAYRASKFMVDGARDFVDYAQIVLDDQDDLFEDRLGRALPVLPEKILLWMVFFLTPEEMYFQDGKKLRPRDTSNFTKFYEDILVRHTGVDDRYHMDVLTSKRVSDTGFPYTWTIFGDSPKDLFVPEIGWMPPTTDGICKVIDEFERGLRP